MSFCRVLVSLLAVLISSGRVLLGFFVITLIVLVSGFMVMVLSRRMMGRCFQVMLSRRMLGGRHDLFLYDCATQLASILFTLRFGWRR